MSCNRATFDERKVSKKVWEKVTNGPGFFFFPRSISPSAAELPHAFLSQGVLQDTFKLEKHQNIVRAGAQHWRSAPEKLHQK